MGQRFVDQGYAVPKPLIPVDGQPMISRVLTSFIKDFSKHRVVAVVQAGFPQIYNVQNVYLGHVTDGAARSVLLGIHTAQLPLDDPLLIVNSDQLVDFDFDDFVRSVSDADGAMIVFPAANPAWSYAEINGLGQVVRVAEKDPISGWATAGFYWWKRTGDFVHCANEMMVNNERVNNEFYVAPVYNSAIREGALVVPYKVEASAHHSLGTPEALREYEQSRVPA